MSIFGPCSPTSGGASDTSGQEQDDLAEYAKKSHVNAQDALRILKAGDTMSGDLCLGGNLVCGLPTAFPPLYQGDEAVSWAQAVSLVDGAVGGDTGATRVKPIIALWAEQNGSLHGGSYEWSFGNGSSGEGHVEIGFPMPAPGRIKSMALCASPAGVGVHVGLVVNGSDVPGRQVSKSTTQASGVVRWRSAYELAPGDHVNFKTISTSGPPATCAVVSLLIELDMP